MDNGKIVELLEALLAEYNRQNTEEQDIRLNKITTVTIAQDSVFIVQEETIDNRTNYDVVELSHDDVAELFNFVFRCL